MAEVARGADVVCVMVRDDEQVRDVVRQAVAGAPAIVAIHSTIGPGTAAALAAEFGRQAWRSWTRRSAAASWEPRTAGSR